MTEPTQESLDEAAKAAGYTDWQAVYGVHVGASIIAHAHTLDQLHGREPVDPVKALAEEMTNTARRYGTTLEMLAEAAIRRGMTLAPKAEPKPWTDDEICDIYRAWGGSLTSGFIAAFRAHLKERGE